MAKTPITVAYGDGIGPEIMEATLKIIEAAGADLAIDVIEVGEKVYLKGISSGMEASSWDILRKNKIFLKAPITTPQGGGFKSLNVTTRKTLGLYANVRPCQTFHPYVATKHPVMDLVIIRENEEDLYTGIEYQQTQDVVQSLKIISRPGCEKIIRYAFEYARSNGRKKVTCMSKDNIMKQTDGLFHKLFEEIGEEYQDLQKEHWIIDIGTAFIADRPEIFDVIVTLNLYGDIISDVAAQISGSVGMCGSSNVGEKFAMFEAVHGSAPTIAGKNIANPSGLLNAAIMMLVHIQQPEVAGKVHNAWLKTIEDGVHTGDVFKEGISSQKVGTREFAQAVISRLGSQPSKFKAVSYKISDSKEIKVKATSSVEKEKRLVGVDVYLDWKKGAANDLGKQVAELSTEQLALKMITNGGVKVYPGGQPETFLSDQWRCRFIGDDNKTTHQEIINLLGRFVASNLDFVKTEQLYDFAGVRGYSLGAGE
jgi:isocitrate dehydrogenase